MANPKPDKIWADAVQRAVKRRMENEEGKPQKIERLADKLVDFAMEGQGWAMQEIGNRLDGRPAQAMSVDASLGLSDPLTDLLTSVAARGKRITDGDG